jgi:GT2 family glycosyltransferase
MPSKELISVVVTTYNRCDALAQVLRGLSKQTDQSFETIVADDGSTHLHRDAVFAATLALGMAVTHVWHTDVGFTAARVRNLGVRAAKGSYIVFLDGDCVPEIDFIQQHRRLMEQGCFVNGSRVLLSAGLTQQVVAGRADVVGRPTRFWLAQKFKGDASKLTGLLRFGEWVPRKCNAFSWHGIRSCNMGVWRSDFERVNGFDESFVGWGHEDADFVLRLHNASVVRKNGFCATEVYHLWHPPSSRAEEPLNAQRVRERQRTQQIVADRGYQDNLGSTDVVINRWR